MKTISYTHQDQRIAELNVAAFLLVAAKYNFTVLSAWVRQPGRTPKDNYFAKGANGTAAIWDEGFRDVVFYLAAVAVDEHEGINDASTQYNQKRAQQKLKTLQHDRWADWSTTHCQNQDIECAYDWALAEARTLVNQNWSLIAQTAEHFRTKMKADGALRRNRLLELMTWIRKEI